VKNLIEAQRGTKFVVLMLVPSIMWGCWRVVIWRKVKHSPFVVALFFFLKRHRFHYPGTMMKGSEVMFVTSCDYFCGSLSGSESNAWLFVMF
jgi:hypothetical protein